MEGRCSRPRQVCRVPTLSPSRHFYQVCTPPPFSTQRLTRWTLYTFIYIYGADSLTFEESFHHTHHIRKRTE